MMGTTQLSKYPWPAMPCAPERRHQPLEGEGAAAATLLSPVRSRASGRARLYHLQVRDSELWRGLVQQRRHYGVQRVAVQHGARAAQLIRLRGRQALRLGATAACGRLGLKARGCARRAEKHAVPLGCATRERTAGRRAPP